MGGLRVARLMQRKSSSATNGSDGSEGVTAPEAAAAMAARTVDHVPLNSSLQSIIAAEAQQLEDQQILHQLRLQQQHQRRLQEVAQQTTENAIAAMMAKTAATALAFAQAPTTTGLPAFASSLTPSAALLDMADRAAVVDRASLSSLRLQQLLYQQTQHHLLQQRQLQAAAAAAQPNQLHPSVVRSRALERASTEVDRPDKKRRTLSQAEDDGQEQFDDDDDDPTRRFRPYQSEQWTEKFQELCDFRKAKGHW